mmetsp:Transcript_73136/g.174274  ORF Transcript_73136/g.174274 Transcript_73136/m.174274 type:complete len:306 (-) Transcript_73136:344-1261(-)
MLTYLDPRIRASEASLILLFRDAWSLPELRVGRAAPPVSFFKLSYCPEWSVSALLATDQEALMGRPPASLAAATLPRWCDPRLDIDRSLLGVQAADDTLGTALIAAVAGTDNRFLSRGVTACDWAAAWLRGEAGTDILDAERDGVHEDEKDSRCERSFMRLKSLLVTRGMWAGLKTPASLRACALMFSTTAAAISSCCMISSEKFKSETWSEKVTCEIPGPCAALSAVGANSDDIEAALKPLDALRVSAVFSSTKLSLVEPSKTFSVAGVSGRRGCKGLRRPCGMNKDSLSTRALSASEPEPPAA